MHSELEEINQLVVEMTGSIEQAKFWWNSPNTAFAGQTPTEMWLKNPEIVQTYVNQIFFGGW